MLHIEEFIDADTDCTLFSLQRYFSLSKGMLKYGKCIADVSIKMRRLRRPIAEGAPLMCVLDRCLCFPETSIFALTLCMRSCPHTLAISGIHPQ